MASGKARPHGKASYSFAWNPSQSEWAETPRRIYAIWPRGFRSRKDAIGRVLGNYPPTGYYVKSPYPELSIDDLIVQIASIARAQHAPSDPPLNPQWLQWTKEAAEIFFSWDAATRDAALILSAIGDEAMP